MVAPEQQRVPQVCQDIGQEHRVARLPAQSYALFVELHGPLVVVQIPCHVPQVQQGGGDPPPVLPPG